MPSASQTPDSEYGKKAVREGFAKLQTVANLHILAGQKVFHSNAGDCHAWVKRLLIQRKPSSLFC